jgi:hypothetical protein
MRDFGRMQKWLECALELDIIAQDLHPDAGLELTVGSFPRVLFTI